MERTEKQQLTALGKDNEIQENVKKLILNDNLNHTEKVNILRLAIILYKKYLSDRRFRGCREFTYYILLKYAINYKDYNPLFDFSINTGLYPISTKLQDNLPNLSFMSELTASCAKVLYEDTRNTLLFEQKKAIEDILKNVQESTKDLSYIAPTSYGKSALISKIIQNKNSDKIGIIVPSKSLLSQTYKNIKEEKLNYKLLLHDEMYNNEERYLAIFTQERALRFFDKHDKFFDLLFIDEAHNLLEKDQRSILLSRMIKLNRQKKPSSKNIYLSPLIENSKNLEIGGVNIIESKIQYSIKEPEYFEYGKDNTLKQYNRFFNVWYDLSSSTKSYWRYILSNSGDKNFIFLVSPKKIESLAKGLVDHLSIIQAPEISEIGNTLSDYVSPKFQMIDFIKKGVIYLHGKLPDEIKGYLEYKFQHISLLKYVIANSVILEGINLPIDKMFIMQTRYQTSKSIINLIGRVNRLNHIFKKDSPAAACLEKLVPHIHFINSDEYNQKNGHMKNLIEKLRSSSFQDEKNNPILKNPCELTPDEQTMVRIEEVAVGKDNTSLKARLIHHNINIFYKDFESKISSIEKNIERIKNQLMEGQDISPLDRVSMIFIDSVISDIDLQNSDIDTYKADFEFLRLKDESARNYYTNYFLHARAFPFSQRVLSQVNYFKNQIQQGNNEFYIGKSFGEIPKSTSNYPESLRVYVDLSEKNDIDLTNLSVIKLKIEQDFISYKLSRCFSFMYEYKLLTEEEYHFLIYGTHNIEDIKYIKAGLSIGIISKLKKDDQLGNLNFDEYNNLNATPIFQEYLSQISDFDRFQIENVL